MTANGRFSVLVTGGTGYIGSHAVVELIRSGYRVFVLDNLSNSKPAVLDRIEMITGVRPDFSNVDVRDKPALADLFKSRHFDAVLHFAGLKSVGESMEHPQRYYDNNVVGSLTLFEVMAEAGVRQLVFSSSATVYGNPHAVPVLENFPLLATNPYGRSKLMVEDILRDIVRAGDNWRVVLLRYFNPAGAHESGLMGEDPNDIPNNLMPYVTQVAVGKQSELQVYGGDYPTRDGTGVRDYVHVVDLARGHLAALEKISQFPGLVAINLGTGTGCSVLEVIQAMEKVSGRAIPYRIVKRRQGDIAECFAQPALARELLNWTARHGIEDMCRDAWRWQSMNPDGY